MILRARTCRVAALAGAAALAGIELHATIVWSGLGLNSFWTNSANWEGGNAPANDGSEQIQFGSSGRSVVVVNTPQSIRRLRFDFSSGDTRVYSLSGLTGSTLTLGADGIELISGTTGAVSDSRISSILSPAGGTVNIQSSLSLVLGAAQTWDVDGESSLNVAGTVSGNGRLTITGDGVVTLSGNNTYSGGTVLDGGNLALEHNSALGTGSLTVSNNSAIKSSSGARTIANALNLNSSFLDLLPYGGDLRLTGPVTLGANTTLRNYGQLVHLTGAIGESGGARSLSIAGYSAVVLSGLNTYTGGTAVHTGALLFSNASAVPAIGALSASSSGYVGIGFNTGVQSDFVSKFSAVNMFGTIGFDTDPTAANPTIFTEAISVSALNAFARLGTATRATLSPTAVITPAAAAGYRFGGGGGTLRVESKLTGANGVTVDSPTFAPLTVLLTNTANDYTGLTTVTDSALMFAPGAVSSGSASGSFLLGNAGYIGSADPGITLSTWLGKFSAATLTGVIGFDSSDVSTPRTVTGTFDLSPFLAGTSIALGTASAATLSGSLVLSPTQTDFHFTGYKGGWLAVDLILSGARGLKIGNAFGDYPEYDVSSPTRMSSVFINGSNTHSAGTSLYSGRLVLGHASALGTGSLTVDGSGANVSPVLETSLSTNPTFSNQLIVKDDFTIAGANSFTWSGNLTDGTSTGSIRKEGAHTLTLSGDNSGFSGGFYLNEGTLAFASNTASGSGALDLGYTNAIAAFTSLAPSVHGLASDALTSRVTVGTGTTLTINQTSDSLFRGQIQGPGAIIKTGAANLRLDSAGSFSGGTTISAGTITAAATGALGNSTVTLNGTTSRLALETGVTLANAIAFGASGGHLAGQGTFGSHVTIGTNSVVSPGSSVGTLAFTNGLTLAPGGTYDLEIQDATGGAGIGWDFAQVTGPLDFTATLNSPFTLNLISLSNSGAIGNVANFISGNAYAWAIASATSFVGFNSAAVNINTANFTSALNGGSFSLSTSGSNLLLNFTPVPEPSTWALMIAGLGIAGFRKLRRRR